MTFLTLDIVSLSLFTFKLKISQSYLKWYKSCREWVELKMYCNRKSVKRTFICVIINPIINRHS